MHDFTVRLVRHPDLNQFQMTCSSRNTRMLVIWPKVALVKLLLRSSRFGGFKVLKDSNRD